MIFNNLDMTNCNILIPTCSFGEGQHTDTNDEVYSPRRQYSTVQYIDYLHLIYYAFP